MPPGRLARKSTGAGTALGIACGPGLSARSNMSATARLRGSLGTGTDDGAVFGTAFALGRKEPDQGFARAAAVSLDAEVATTLDAAEPESLAVRLLL